MKKALITGITGQDGSYLAAFLLQKGYEVHGIVRRTSLPNTSRIDYLRAENPALEAVKLHYGDMTDSLSLTRIVMEVQPDEIYNLAAQSHVKVSFDVPEYTADVDALGALRLLEAVRIAGMSQKTRIYQASTSELFGLVQEVPQKETTPFYPRSPYACAKLYAYWIFVNYREAYGMYACNGILFNHESSLRGENFVTRKITKSMAQIAFGQTEPIRLGNLDAKRDWGHAKDYVEMQWLMLQQDTPDDYVIATGRQYSVREFVNLAAAELGIQLEFQGTGLQEHGIVASVDKKRFTEVTVNGICPKVGQAMVQVDPRFYRPTEVDSLLGDASKARKKLGWEPKITLSEMAHEMMLHDVLCARQECVVAEKKKS